MKTFYKQYYLQYCSDIELENTLLMIKQISNDQYNLKSLKTTLEKQVNDNQEKLTKA